MEKKFYFICHYIILKVGILFSIGLWPQSVKRAESWLGKRDDRWQKRSWNQNVGWKNRNSIIVPYFLLSLSFLQSLIHIIFQIKNVFISITRDYWLYCFDKRILQFQWWCYSTWWIKFWSSCYTKFGYMVCRILCIMVWP